MVRDLGARYAANCQTTLLFFGISLLVIIPGLIALIVWGFPLGIDFTGGSLLQVQLESGTTPAVGSGASTCTPSTAIGDSLVQTSPNGVLIIRSSNMDEATEGSIVAAMEQRFNSKVTVQRFDSVGPAIGTEVAARAAGAVILAALGILLYITYAFRGVPHAFRYGMAAIIAMLHDVLVVLGVEAILGHFLGWEVDSLFLTALLTVIGFSVHDTIVVFDRIRENYRHLPPPARTRRWSTTRSSRRWTARSTPS